MAETNPFADLIAQAQKEKTPGPSAPSPPSAAQNPFAELIAKVPNASDELAAGAPAQKRLDYVNPTFTPSAPLIGAPDVSYKSGLTKAQSPEIDLKTPLEPPRSPFADLIDALPKKTPRGDISKSIGNILHQVAGGVEDTYSPELGISRESFGKVMGNLDDPKNREGFIGNLRMLNWAIAHTLSVPLDIGLRSVPAAIEGSIRGLVQSLKEAGYSEYKADDLGRDLRMTADVSLAAFPEWEAAKSVRENIEHAQRDMISGIASGELPMPGERIEPTFETGGAATELPPEPPAKEPGGAPTPPSSGTAKQPTGADIEISAPPGFSPPPKPSANEPIVDLTGFGRDITYGLYSGVFDALEKGNSMVAGVREPLLVRAKPYYDAGLIKSPDDLQKLVAANYDPVVAGLKETTTASTASQPTTAPTAALPAYTGVVYTPRGRMIETRPVVMDITDLVASHTDDLNPNEAYPVGLQPRNRTRAASQAQIQSIAGNLNPALLGDSPSASEGAPIIGADKAVESGNGRVLALRRAYKEGLPGADAYRSWLRSQGYDIEGIAQPVLVRQRLTQLSDEERIAFAREANERATLGMATEEQAAADAKAMPDWLVDLYRGGELTSAANRELINKFSEVILSDAERAAFMTDAGELSQDGLRRVQNALFERAWGDSALLGALRAETESNIKTIGDAMMDSAPAWSRMRAAVERGEIAPETDPTKPIVAAARLVSKAREDKLAVGDLVGQTDILGGGVSAETEKALSLFYKDAGKWKRPRSKKDISAGLRYIAEQAELAKAEEGLFGADKVTAGDLLDLGVDKIEGGKLAGLFEQRLASRSPSATATLPMQPGPNYVGARRQVYDPTVARNDNVIRRENIIGNIAKALNVPVYRGRVRGRNVLGFFRPKIEEVRIRGQNDIETTAHEIAHLLDFRDPEVKRQWSPPTLANKAVRDELRGVSYDDKNLREGFAEFVRLWTTQKQEAQARAPNFYRWWEGYLNRNPLLGETMRKAQADMHAWFDQAALDRMASKIGVDDQITSILDRFGDRWRQTVFDELHGIYRFEHDVTGRINPGGVYESARLTRGSRALTEGAMRFGVPTIQANGSIKFVGKGLQQILEPITPELDSWILYAVGRSAEELRQQGRERLFSDAEIQAALDLETPEYRRAFDEYQEWNKGLLDFAEAKNLIDPDKRAQWQRTQYIPFYRVIDPKSVQAGGGFGGSPGQWNGIRALSGGTGNLRDVLGNIIQNASMLIQSAVENDARLQVADLSKRDEGAHFMAKIPKASVPVRVDSEQVTKAIADALGVPVRDPAVQALASQLDPLMTFFQHGMAPQGRNIVVALRKGRPEYYEVADPVLYRSLVALRPRAKSATMKVLGAVRRLQQGAITLHLNFLAAHLTRDAIQGWVLSENGFKPLFDSARGVFSRFVEDENYRDFIANGGGLFGSHLDEKGFRRYLETYYAKKGISYQTVLNTPRKMWNFLHEFADAFGSGTRIGEYNRAIKAGVEPRHAAFRAREIASDFAMHGDHAGRLGGIIGFLGDTVPFFNASLVSMDRLARAVYRSEEMRRTIAVRLALLSSASIGLYMINRANPQYDQLQEWDKDMHWHIFIPTGRDATGNWQYSHWRIPKAWEIGLMSTLAERTASAILRDERPDSIPMQFLRAILDFEHLDPIPGFAVPVMEAAFNYNFMTGRPLVSEAEKRLEKWEQTNPGTHPSLRRIGEAERHLPDWMQVSPPVMDTILRAYLGNYAETGLLLADRFLNSAPPPERRWDEVPIVRRFFQQAPSKSTRYIEEYYEALDAAMRAHSTVRDLAKHGEMPLAQEEATTRSRELSTYGYMMQQNKTVAALNKLHNAVIDAPDLKTTQQIAVSVDAALDGKYPPLHGIKTKPAFNDVKKLKRVLIDALFVARNERMRTAAETVLPRPKPLIPRTSPLSWIFKGSETGDDARK